MILGLRHHGSAGMTDRRRQVAAAVEGLSQTEMEELFRIIHRNRLEYTRNNHGVFINLAWVSDSMLAQIEAYIDFRKRSHHTLCKYESLCDALTSKLAVGQEDVAPDAAMGKQSRNTATITAMLLPKPDPMPDKGRSNSSAARYTLLKKRYSKTASAPVSRTPTELRHEPYVMG